jgi:hypothetical protein
MHFHGGLIFARFRFAATSNWSVCKPQNVRPESSNRRSSLTAANSGRSWTNRAEGSIAGQFPACQRGGKKFDRAGQGNRMWSADPLSPPPVLPGEDGRGSSCAENLHAFCPLPCPPPEYRGREKLSGNTCHCPARVASPGTEKRRARLGG